MRSDSVEAVAMMRQLRDQLSEAMASMTHEERIRYIREKAARVSLRMRPENTAPVPPDKKHGGGK